MKNLLLLLSLTIFIMNTYAQPAGGFEGGVGNIGVLGTSVNNIGVSGESTNDVGVDGYSLNGIGVKGETESAVGIGILGLAGEGIGVKGSSDDSDGVNGLSQNGNGVFGESKTAGNGVDGLSLDGAGINGTSTNGIGVNGISDNNPGVKGESTNDIGVYGVSSGDIGVNGLSTNNDGVTGISQSQLQNDAGIKGVGQADRDKAAALQVCDGAITVVKINAPETPADKIVLDPSTFTWVPFNTCNENQYCGYCPSHDHKFGRWATEIVIGNIYADPAKSIILLTVEGREGLTVQLNEINDFSFSVTVNDFAAQLFCNGSNNPPITLHYLIINKVAPSTN